MPRVEIMCGPDKNVDLDYECTMCGYPVAQIGPCQGCRQEQEWKQHKTKRTDFPPPNPDVPCSAPRCDEPSFYQGHCVHHYLAANRSDAPHTGKDYSNNNARRKDYARALADNSLLVAWAKATKVHNRRDMRRVWR